MFLLSAANLIVPPERCELFQREWLMRVCFFASFVYHTLSSGSALPRGGGERGEMFPTACNARGWAVSEDYRNPTTRSLNEDQIPQHVRSEGWNNVISVFLQVYIISVFQSGNVIAVHVTIVCSRVAVLFVLVFDGRAFSAYPKSIRNSDCKDAFRTCFFH